MNNYSKLKRKLLKDDAILKEYEELAPEFAIADAIMEKRIEQGMSQADLAKRIGTKQSAISRLESGNCNPSIKVLEKVADALSLKLSISFSKN